MRLFIGIDLPDEIKKKVSKEITQLKKRYPDFRWVEEKNYHITLLFLGEVAEGKLPKIKERLERAVFNISSFYLFSYSFNLFIHHKIVLHIDFRREREIELLAKEIKKEFREFNFKNNTKKFIPHLTIARAKIPSKQQYFVLKKLLEQQKTDFYFKVDKITLFKSTLTKQGPIYEKLFEVSLFKKEK